MGVKCRIKIAKVSRDFWRLLKIGRQDRKKVRGTDILIGRQAERYALG